MDASTWVSALKYTDDSTAYSPPPSARAMIAGRTGRSDKRTPRAAASAQKSAAASRKRPARMVVTPASRAVASFARMDMTPKEAADTTTRAVPRTFMSSMFRFRELLR
jgi:hypothetical protein